MKLSLECWEEKWGVSGGLCYSGMCQAPAVQVEAEWGGHRNQIGHLRASCLRASSVMVPN